MREDLRDEFYASGLGWVVYCTFTYLTEIHSMRLGGSGSDGKKQIVMLIDYRAADYIHYPDHDIPEQSI